MQLQKQSVPRAEEPGNMEMRIREDWACRRWLCVETLRGSLRMLRKCAPFSAALAAIPAALYFSGVWHPIWRPICDILVILAALPGCFAIGHFSVALLSLLPQSWIVSQSFVQGWGLRGGRIRWKRVLRVQIEATPGLPDHHTVLVHASSALGLQRRRMGMFVPSELIADFASLAVVQATPAARLDIRCCCHADLSCLLSPRR